jgi:hypothetical protein
MVHIAGKKNSKRGLTEKSKVIEKLGTLGGVNILEVKGIRCEVVIWIHLVLHRGRVAGSFEYIN